MLVASEICSSGVRPPSGAVMSTNSEVAELSSVLCGSEAAAPEDGRTPAQSPSLGVPFITDGFRFILIMLCFIIFLESLPDG